DRGQRLGIFDFQLVLPETLVNAVRVRAKQALVLGAEAAVKSAPGAENPLGRIDHHAALPRHPPRVVVEIAKLAPVALAACRHVAIDTPDVHAIGDVTYAYVVRSLERVGRILGEIGNRAGVSEVEFKLFFHQTARCAHNDTDSVSRRYIIDARTPLPCRQQAARLRVEKYGYGVGFDDPPGL